MTLWNLNEIKSNDIIINWDVFFVTQNRLYKFDINSHKKSYTKNKATYTNHNSTSAW